MGEAYFMRSFNNWAPLSHWEQWYGFYALLFRDSEHLLPHNPRNASAHKELLDSPMQLHVNPINVRAAIMVKY
jgi:hypothetical protein